MRTPREIIEKIRRDEFYIGTDFNIDSIKRKFNNALTKLSDDLYSEDIHFVLELIQNADDNKYESGKSPVLKFIIESDKILIQNNEEGFAEENILALCSVGESTKTKQEGYIGEKGIGFKSVFRISDEPQIFSKGFHFKFKRTDEDYGLGYIVPYWIEEVPDFIDRKLTNILLPLNNEAKEELSKFSEIEPELLLFLRNLHRVEIQNNVDNVFNSYIKSEEDGKIKLSSNKTINYYKLVSQVLKVPENIQEENRKILDTKLVLGFPINQNGSAKIQTEQKVFAFLPTRSYGFKFMIQADFLVPASREDIHKDKKWNDWLRDNISAVFLKSIETFKNDKNLKVSFYNYIPLESEITDEFFSNVVEQLKDQLLDSSCVFTESSQWLKPSQVFRASEEIRSLVSNEDLLEFFGKEFISKLIEETVNSKVLDFLEVENFSTSHLLDLLKNTDWLAKKSNEWLIKLYGYLNNKLSKSGISTVKKLQIVRLKNGEMKSPAKEIFFPLKKRHSYGFEKQLPFIDKEIVKGNEEFLKNLGVLNAEPFNVIENYILRDFENNDENQNWKSKKEEVLIGYINYIKDNLAEYEKENDKRLNSNKHQYQTKDDPLQHLKHVIKLRCKTKIGDEYQKPNFLYLPKQYRNEVDLNFLFSRIDDFSYVHPQYVELSYKEIIKTERNKTRRKELQNKVLEEWKTFFIKLGVSTKPLIYVNSNHGRWGGDTIYHSSAISKIIAEDNPKKNSLFLKTLDFNWDSYYKKFTTNTICYLPNNDYRYNLRSRTEESEWFEKLKKSKWLPTKNGGLEQSSKLFLDKPETRKILGDSVLYLDAEIKNENFLKALSINAEVSVETVIEVLKDLVNAKNSDKERFEKLYLFLNENYKGHEDQIKKHFYDDSLIFIPEIPSRYISVKKAIWKDVSQIFGDYRYYLENYYPKLKNFFVQKLGISERPLAEDYAKILVEISTKNPLEKEDKEKILKIYKELNKFLENEDLEDLSITNEDWWNEFTEENIFWTNKSEFWRNDDDVFVNNDEELYDLFKDKDTVAFLKIPSTEIPRLEHFIKRTELKSVSEKITAEIETSVECEYEEELTNNINSLLIYTLRYLYHKESNAYKKLKETGKLLEVLSLKCFWVLDLHIKYTLQTESATKDEFLYLDKNKLYVKVENLEDYGRISIELSKAFGSPKGLSEFIETLLLKPSDEKRAESLKIRKIGNLPYDEYQWFIKSSNQVVVDKTSIDSPDSDITNERKNQADNLASEKDQANNYTESEYNSHNFTHQKNVEDKISQSESISSSNTGRTETPSASHPKPSQTPQVQNENAAQDDWNSEVDPSDFEPSETEDAIPKFKPSTVPSNRNTQTNSKSSSTEKGNNESSKDNLSQEAKRKIGKWGEEFAVEKLKEKFLGKYTNCKLLETDTGFNILVNNQIKVEVKWLNKHIDNGIGRDIEYVENGEEFFVEVKATKTDAKEIFQISRSEWQLAKDKQENYSIYRVYNAGTKQARAEEISNPYKEWLEEKLLVQSLTIKI